MEHGKLIRLPVCQFINKIKCEIELLSILELHIDGRAVLVELNVDIILIDPGLLLDLVILDTEDLGSRLVVDTGLTCSVEDEGIERTVLAVRGDHAVGHVTVEVDRVTGA